jgi:catechol 2,3-dioxygenase-like lactoylglutathione lyase family enzyme
VEDRPALDHVQIAAPPDSEERARVFYGELLGLPEIAKPLPLRSRGGCWFALAGTELHVGIEEEFHPARKAHPALRFSAEGLRGVAARLTAAGVPLRWDAELPGVRRAFAEDPWGNRIVLLARTR